MSSTTVSIVICHALTVSVGARGSTMKVWTNIAGTSVSDLIAADGYPNLPDVFYNIEDFASPLQ